MRNIEILIGSPRKNGNTSIMAKYLHENALLSGMSSKITFLYDHTIQACTDCRGCKKGKKECFVLDDASEIYARLEKADIIIFGTPVYWFGPSATMKLLIDRLRPYYLNKKLAGKKAAVFLPAGEGAKDCDLTIEMFKRVFQTLGMIFMGAVTAKAYDIGDLNKNKKVHDPINRLSAKLV
jgi:multimeric flavodoxin WrbA